mmetsp:Transcript_45920/g.60866  ORF Transcript_45920/g.60866 Transcript_45920/m.60866 type:complete len:104 (+) Transcript_45920:51-362(+)
MKNLLLPAVLLCAVFDLSGQSTPDLSNIPEHPESIALTCSDTCPWDFDNDGFTSVDNDLLSFLTGFGTFTTEGCENGDFNEDMTIDVQDLRLFLPRLGMICPQ